MHYQQLQAFREVANEGSFTRAAANLHYAQSSITAQIQNLEEAVGAILFDRSRRQVTLTPAGECLLPYADHIIKVTQAARRQVATTVVRHPRTRRSEPRPAVPAPQARPACEQVSVYRQLPVRGPAIAAVPPAIGSPVPSTATNASMERTDP